MIDSSDPNIIVGEVASGWFGSRLFMALFCLG
jgi:hypothetical protein